MSRRGYSVCCIPKCNRRSDSFRFFRVPATPKNSNDCSQFANQLRKRRNEWLKILLRLKVNVRASSRVCEMHFQSGSPADLFDERNPDWVPTLEMDLGAENPADGCSNETVQHCADHHRPDQTGTASPDLNIRDGSIQAENPLKLEADVNSSSTPNTKLHLSHEDEFIDPTQFLVSTFHADDDSGPVQPSSPKQSSPMEPVDNDRFQVDKQLLDKTIEEFINNGCQQTGAAKPKREDPPLSAFEMRSEIDRLNAEIAFQKETITTLKKEMCELIEEFDSSKRDTADSSRSSKRLINSLKGSNRLVRFYTGLNTYTLFDATFGFLSHGLEENSNAALPLQEQFMLTLMKLRLNLRMQDLALRFNVSESSASRYCQKWINILSAKLVPNIIVFPRRDLINRALPECFRESFEKCVAIIDCFKIRLNTPSNVHDHDHDYDNKMSACSQYKSGHTVKYLVGILPTGAIAFVSESYCGRNSDKFIVEDSGFLGLLEPGDVVMADRGFTVSEMVGTHGAEFITPDFKDVKPHLARIEVEESSQVANVRTHVERIVGATRSNFSVLNGPLAIPHVDPNSAGLHLIDKIVAVCFALQSLNPAVAPVN